MAGLPDITTKERDYLSNYQEVIFMGSPPETVPMLETQLVAISNIIKSLGWTPVFCPVTPMSLEDWNSPSRTTYLLHHQQFDGMQKLLENTVISLNHIIRAINKSNKVYTPNIQKSIMKVHQGKTKFLYNRFRDGCHPNKTTATEWCKILEKSMAINNLRGALPIVPC
jgi:hypothetical protein